MNEQEIYRGLCSILDRTPCPPASADLEEFEKHIQEIWSETERIDTNVYQVNSPWHAAILCSALMAMNTKQSESNTHFSFRGEGNFAWKEFGPSYFREKDKQKRQLFKRTMANFAYMLKFAADQCFANKKVPQNFDIMHFVGAAQHYFGNTHLMDWTSDPSVAVAFANDSDHAEHSVVYLLPTRTAIRHGAVFYLPPPFVERLYLQRGLFIQPRTKASLKEDCVAIRFSKDPHFRVIRNKTELQKNDLLKVEPSFDLLIEHCKRLADNGIELSEGGTRSKIDGRLAAEWELFGGIPSFLRQENSARYQLLWQQELIETLERVSRFPTECGLSFDSIVLRAFVQSNRHLMTHLEAWLNDTAVSALKTKENDLGIRTAFELSKIIRCVFAFFWPANRISNWPVNRMFLAC